MARPNPPDLVSLALATFRYRRGIGSRSVARKHHADAMKRIPMPGQRLTWRQPLPADQCRATAKENFVCHSICAAGLLCQTPLLIYFPTIVRGRRPCPQF